MFEGVENFRELGGLPTTDGRTVRSGSLFRSGHLGAATDGDLALLRTFGVAVIVDFRNDEDLAADGLDRVPDGVRHVRAPIGDDAGRTSSIRSMIADGGSLEELLGDGRARQMVIDGYRRTAVAAWCVEAYSTFVEELNAHAGSPVLWHCSAGKDRAGWAGCVVALALGVERDAMIDNYLESNVHRKVDEVLAQYGRRGVDAELLRPFMEVRAEYVEASIAAAEGEWGSLDAYLRDGLGLTDTARAQLQDVYLV